jgi:peptidoglycan/xylan/chitin deacetylase (PgdA/CDA1 family)
MVRMKRIANFLVSSAVFAFSWSIQSFRKLLGLPVRPTAVVLYYHSVRDVDQYRFAAQMDELLDVCTPIRADIDPPLEPGRRYAAVTFDDGLESVVKNALPELTKRRIPCTLFIITEALGQIAGWNVFENDTDERESVMSAEQLCALPSDVVTIGSHTLTHPMLTVVEADTAKREIAESRTKLEHLLKRDVRLFSFPYGAFNGQLVECCASAGYTRVFSILPKLAFLEPREFLTGRVAADPSDWPLEFRLKLLGAYSWLPFAFLWKQKLKAIWQ